MVKSCCRDGVAGKTGSSNNELNSVYAYFSRYYLDTKSNRLLAQY